MKQKKVSERQIISNLLKDEEIEESLISLYISLLDLGLENCLDAEQRDNFYQGINTLYQESKKHQEIIKRMLESYQDESD